MNKNILKSIGAIIAGFILGAVLSILTDLILEKTGAMTTQPFDANPTWLIAVVTLYRCIYNTVGCYLAGVLAPNRPMRHAMIIGWVGLALSIAGAIAMRDQGPTWYPIALIIFTLPCAWLGGKLAESKSQNA